MSGPDATFPQHETRDLRARRLVLPTLALLAAVLAVAGGAVAVIDWRLPTDRATPPVAEWPAVAGPERADPAIPTRAAAAARLTGTGWVDRERGIAHIPIGTAMRLLVARGWREEAIGAEGPP